MRKPVTFNENYIGSVKQMSIYRVSDAPPDWAQDDPSQPDYIKNKPELVAGENVVLTKIGNKIIISAVEVPDNPDIPDVPDEPDVPDVPDVPDEPEEPDIPDIPSEEGTVIDTILDKQIPVYVENDGQEVQGAFNVLDETSLYTDQGLYVFTTNGKITAAGYQVTFEGSEQEVAQSILILKDAKIISAYQYQIALGQWIPMGMDGTYWIAGEEVTKTINGEEFEYIRYTYNSDLWGEPIMAQEYWRFEMEV